MLLSRLAETRIALAGTRSRNAKRDLIAAVLREASDDDVEIVVSYLSGSLRQRRTGVGWKSLQTVPPAAEEPSLTVGEVDAVFAHVGSLSGAGSTAARSAAVQALLARATADEQDLLRGLVFGELRQGAMEAAVQEGLAAAFDVPVAAVRRAAMLMSSTTAAAAVLLAGGLEALEAVGLRVGVGIQPMLAASAPDPDAALEKTGLPAVVDYKLDGVRLQVHRSGEEVRIFTRSLDDITTRLPEVAAVARSLPHDQLVLDGEVLSLRTDGRPEAFQVVASRTMSSVDVAGPAQTGPLQVFFFDLLHVDGQDLLDVPLAERLDRMRQLLPESVTVPRKVCATAAEAADTFADAVKRGYEGVVIKNLAGPVRCWPSRRRVGQGEAATHLRPDCHSRGVGSWPPPGLAIQPPPRGTRSRVGKVDHAWQDLQGPHGRTADVADETLPRAGGPAYPEHRLRRTVNRGRNRL